MKFPKSAVVTGYKVLSECRESPLHPAIRSRGCGDLWKLGSRLKYSRRRIVTSDLCECKSDCCEGIHFFSNLQAANRFAGLLCRNSFVVLCYVPKGGKYIIRDHKLRADKLVCL